MKKHKLWIIVATTVGGTIVFGILMFFVFKNKKSTFIASKPLTYFLDSAIAEADKSKIKDLIDANKSDNPVQQVSSRSQAELVISTSKDGDMQVLSEKFIASPQKLQSSVLVDSSKQPELYISSSARTDFIKSKITQYYQNASSQVIPWSLNVAGDIIIGRTVYEQEMRRNDYTSSFQLVKNLLSGADYTIADAEWTAADGIPHPLEGMSFSSPSKSLEGLTYAGIDAVSLANNHSMNGGIKPFEQMLDSLKARGIGYFGAGRNYSEAHTPYIADIKGIKVAFLGYTSIPGNYEAGESSTGNAFIKITPWYPFSEADVAQMEKDIRDAKTKADVVIPYFHWSKEYVHQPNEQMRTVAHRAIDAGATMVVGSHPHWVQGLEWYKDTLIAYSLGNFVFDQEQMLKTKQGVVLKTQFENNKLIRAELVPIQIEHYFQPHVLESPGKEGVLNDIFSNSFWPGL